MTQLINSLKLSTGKNGENISFDFITPGEAGVFYNKVKEEFEELTSEEVNEGFGNKHVLEMSIVPIAVAGQINTAASITPTAYFDPTLYDEIVEFVKREFNQSKE